MESLQTDTDHFAAYLTNQAASILKLNTSKLSNSDPTKPPAVLFYFGTFCPIHKGHLDLMHKSVDFVSQTQSVLGGFISPCHPRYLDKKLPDHAISASLRNYLVEIAIESDPVWVMDEYQSSTEGMQSQLDVLLKFHERINANEVVIKLIGEQSIEIFWVVGVDNFEPIPMVLAERGFRMVIIDNRGASVGSLGLFQETITDEQKKYMYFIEVYDLGISSTKIRKACEIGDIELLNEMIGNVEVVQEITYRKLWSNKIQTVIVKSLPNLTPQIFDKLLSNMDQMTEIFEHSRIISTNQKVMNLICNRIGQYQGWSGEILKLSDIHVYDHEANEETILPLSYVLKYCQNTNHSYERQDEPIIMNQLANLLISPKCPKVYLKFQIQNDEERKVYPESSKPKFAKNTNKYAILMDYIEDGSIVDRLANNQTPLVIDRLSELNAFFINSSHLKSLIFGNKVIQISDPKMVTNFQRRLIKDFLPALSKDHKARQFCLDLSENMSKYFAQLSNSPYQTLIHSDLTQNNLMLNEQGDVWFFDWQTAFVAGNPMIDLAFLMYYATDLTDIRSGVEFYERCLRRHGKKITNAEMLFKQGLPMAFLRWATGSGSVRIYLAERSEDIGGRRFEQLIDACLEIYNNKEERLQLFGF